MVARLTLLLLLLLLNLEFAGRRDAINRGRKGQKKEQGEGGCFQGISAYCGGVSSGAVGTVAAAVAEVEGAASAGRLLPMPMPTALPSVPARPARPHRFFT